MVTLRSPEALKNRFERRFLRMARESQRIMARRRVDLATGILRMHAGTPEGPGRLVALREADHPFARRHGSPLWPTPPIGIITGDLAHSLRFPTNVRGNATITGGTYTVQAKSVGTGYARFVYAIGGTSKMVDRRVKDAAYVLSADLSRRTLFEWMQTQRGLL